MRERVAGDPLWNTSQLELSLASRWASRLHSTGTELPEAIEAQQNEATHKFFACLTLALMCLIDVIGERRNSGSGT